MAVTWICGGSLTAGFHFAVFSESFCFGWVDPGRISYVAFSTTGSAVKLVGVSLRFVGTDGVWCPFQDWQGRLRFLNYSGVSLHTGNL